MTTSRCTSSRDWSSSWERMRACGWEVVRGTKSRLEKKLDFRKHETPSASSIQSKRREMLRLSESNPRDLSALGCEKCLIRDLLNKLKLQNLSLNLTLNIPSLKKSTMTIQVSKSTLNSLWVESHPALWRRRKRLGRGLLKITKHLMTPCGSTVKISTKLRRILVGRSKLSELITLAAINRTSSNSKTSFAVKWGNSSPSDIELFLFL